MVVPPAVALGYLVYWPRTTEQGAYWGMVVGYGAGLIWFGLIKIALATGFTAPDSAGFVRQVFVYGLTVNGEGIDPSYLTFFVPLAVVPVVSRLTSNATAQEDFYDMLSGRKPVENTP